VSPIVADANRLGNDILYACRRDQRTTLVTAANAGLFRLFCAQHVIDEVWEKSAEWTQGSPVSRAAFLRCWLTEYLPLIRVVREPLPDDLFTPAEFARIAELARVDPDDVPSAKLALALGAFHLSDDRPALRAVYGLQLDLAEHHAWVEALKAGGDAGELRNLLRGAVALAVVFGGGLAAGVKRMVAALGPWIVVIAAAAGVVVVSRISAETRRRLKGVVIAAGESLAQAYLAHAEVSARFGRAAPRVPKCEELRATNHPQAVLARACLATLPRSGRSHLSAEDLAKELPFLGVPQAKARVRSTLRSHRFFFGAWRGRWQVGEVVAASLARGSASTIPSAT